MPFTGTYPGVYIEEIPSGVRTITGVSTSIGAFVDYFPQGPLDTPVQIFSYADFQRSFGGLDSKSEASYGIQQFFLNGGSQAYVVRVTSGTAGNAAASAQITLQDAATGGANVLTATASTPGSWGNGLRLDVDYDTTDPTKLFNLMVTQLATVNGKIQAVATEVFRNLVVDASKPNDAAKVIGGGSALITLATAAGGTGKRPAPTGTVSAFGDITGLGIVPGKFDISIQSATMPLTSVGQSDTLVAADLASPAAFAAALQALIAKTKVGTNPPGLSNATVSIVGSGTSRGFVIEAGAADPTTWVILTDVGPGNAATKLGVTAATTNLQQYSLGGGAARAGTTPVAGGDGVWDPSTDSSGIALGLIGNQAAKTGMYALLDTDLFNILCIPATANLQDTAAAQVSADAIKLCFDRRAFYLLDAPQAEHNRDSVTGIMTWLDGEASLRSGNAALYFPRMDIADPLNGFRLRAVPPSGTVAGLYARTDGNRGVWKAPAGTEASLSGVQKLEYKLTDPENGVLNPLAINCLRNFPVYGPVCWGARTLLGADQLADDYKYVPVKRLALFIEESLFRGTQWVVFEPNAAPLWAQVRLNVGAFMQNLFRQGAFFGTTPQQAYFVQCDATNNPQNTINLGILNVAVGFAPLKPAEFVVIQIQQIAGDIAS
jgi:hypothetical protein